jgi:acetyltransferase-like isoleucine patch superfamily enzyme
MAPQLRGLFAEVAGDVFIEAPFHCSYGINIRLGSRVYLNAGCTILDSGIVRIGARSMLGPGVLRRTPQGSGPEGKGDRGRVAGGDRRGRVDRRRSNHHGWGDDRQRGARRRRRGGDESRAAGSDGGGQSGEADCWRSLRNLANAA